MALPVIALISAKAEIAKTYIVFRCWITDQDHTSVVS